MKAFIIGGIIVSILLCLCPSAHAGWKVAIFDFDDRLDEPDTVAKYLEKTLLEEEHDILVDHYSGEGNEAVAVERIRELDRAGYDLIVTITSDALILAKHFLKTTPTLYTNVNNPLFLGFSTLEAPGGNISGASYYIPILHQLKFFQSIQPNMKKLGFLFDEHNRSRQAEVRESREACHTLDLSYAIRLLTNAEELAQKTQELIDEGVGAIVVTSSETIYNNLHHFKALCEEAGIPIYSYHRKAVEAGAIAALSSDYYRMVERLVVPMALRVLREHISPGTLPVAFLNENLMFINLTEADKLGIHIPEKILKQATAIY